jgi:hypothetical protein
MAKARKKPQGKPERDEGREERISTEVVVDAYDESERAMGWYYYLEDRLNFSFLCEAVVRRPIRSGGTAKSLHRLRLLPARHHPSADRADRRNLAAFRHPGPLDGCCCEARRDIGPIAS